MAYIYYNPNPVAAHVADCAVRAVAKALHITWEDAYIRLTINGINMGDIISNDNVWGSVLRQNGFYKAIIPNSCPLYGPDCYTVKDFCHEHPVGTYVLGFGEHAATVVNGDLYDSWDSSKMVPIYYWYKKEDVNGSVSGINGANTERSTSTESK